MTAAVQTSYGGPDIVRVTEVHKPEPGVDDLLVRVHAATVNRTDCGYRAAKPFIIRSFSGLLRPKSKVLGTEFAGEVKAIGNRVSNFEVGDKDFGHAEGRFGAHAEHLAVPSYASVATMPANLTFDEAAPSTEGCHYALAYIRAAKIDTGQKVLVNGATGAIGSAAIQLMKSFGAEVTAVCGPEHMELVKRMGAVRVIDYTAVDFTEDPQVYDVVFDAVGKGSFARCKRLLTRKGIYFSTDLGPFPQNPILAVITPLFGGRRVLFPIPKHDQTMVEYIRGLIESGAFTPVVDRQYLLDEIVEAYRYVESGRKVGNVVIRIVGQADQLG